MSLGREGTRIALWAHPCGKSPPFLIGQVPGQASIAVRTLLLVASENLVPHGGGLSQVEQSVGIFLCSTRFSMKNDLLGTAPRFGLAEFPYRF